MQNTNFKTLMDHRSGLFGYAMALTHNYASAADVVQETYLRAFSAKERLPEPSEVKAWLFTILRNIWLNELRRRPTMRETVHLSNEDTSAPAATDSTNPHVLYLRRSVITQVREAI